MNPQSLYRPGRKESRSKNFCQMLLTVALHHRAIVKHLVLTLVCGTALVFSHSHGVTATHAAKRAFNTSPVCIVDPIVTSAGDNGSGSLRQAILDACDGSTITFNLESMPAITLSTSELLINKSLTVVGPGVTVQRSSSPDTPDFRIFHIDTGNFVVAFEGLTIRNGKSAGGAIYNASTSTVTISNSTISGNNSPFFCGGIYTEGSLTISGSTVVGNSADTQGGGICGGGTLTITNSTISSNSAIEGGGIVNFGTLMLVNAHVSSNVATFGGGGGIMNSGTATIVDSVIGDNSSGAELPNIAGGGGIYNQSGVSPATLSIRNSTISNNLAVRGGGIYLKDGSLNMIVSTIKGNVATRLPDQLAGRGGGVFNRDGQVSVTSSTISGNHADGNGGGVANSDGHGFISFVNSTISGNSSSSGGGIANRGSSTAVFKSCTISNNYAESVAGGIVSDGFSASIGNSVIADNHAGFSPDLQGHFGSLDYNLIGSAEIVTAYDFSGGPTGHNLTGIEARLAPLADNGGPTQTHALLYDSPAIDRGHAILDANNNPINVDQRGLTRPVDLDNSVYANVDDATDIGAFESQAILPLPAVVSADATIINESCPPSNGAIDPGERVTVHLKLSNDGPATSHLVATLQSGSGVIAPGSSQNFGVIAPGQPVARAFSFTVDPALSCGGTITATLQLHDRFVNLGTVSYTFTLGVNSGGSYVCTTPCGGVRLIVTSTLSRIDPDNVRANIALQNIGSITATSIRLETVKLGVLDGTWLTEVSGSLAPGESVIVPVNFETWFPGPGMLTVRGTYAGGNFSSSQRVSVP